MVQNVKHIISKYNVKHHELLYMYMSAIQFKCKETRNINGNSAYCDWANMICELVVIGDCNNDAVLNKEECNAVISYLSTI